MLIFNGTVGLLVDHLGTATGIDEAVDLAVRAGGYIAQQTDTTVILRVPSGKFRKVMRGVEKLGDVQSRSVQTLDVSEEFHDLGRDLATADVRDQLRGRLLAFLAARRHRTTVSDAQVAAATAGHKRAGVFYGQW